MEKEYIDGIIEKCFQKATGDDIWKLFLENMNIYYDMLKETNMPVSDVNLATYCAACIQTAQQNSIDTIREVLYNLFCREE